jgi:hypothetical protein
MAESLLDQRVAVVTGAGQGFAEREAAVPMKRAGQPAEVAGAVVEVGGGRNI